MNKDNTLGLILIALLLGGVVLLSRRSTALTAYSPHPQSYNDGTVKVVPMAEEPKRYKNKETRRIEYNEDGLPTLIEITRDYAVT